MNLKTLKRKSQVRPREPKQIEMLGRQNLAYGGELLKTRQGRSRGRPLDTKNSMHMVLRSSKAVGTWSFKEPKNDKKIREIVIKFTQKYGVKLISLGNVGNHLHFHIKLGKRHTYKPFIRALTAAIAMAVTGASRWNPLKKEAKDKFWDYRPFTRVVQSWRAFLTLKDYIKINQYEGGGLKREHARMIVVNRSPRLSSA
ncbi:MAG: transposase [Bdellovibrionales bacterium]